MSSISEIDHQHQVLIGKLNKLNDAVKRSESRQRIFDIIDEVIEFTCLHFEEEEKVMANSGYPHLEHHKKLHAGLIEDARRLKNKMDYVGEISFLDWFNHWPFSRVLAHIQYADSQIVDHVYLSGLEKETILELDNRKMAGQY